MPIKKIKKISHNGCHAAGAGVTWLFLLSTRLAEFINAVGLMSFAITMMVGFDDFIKSHPYRKFTYASNELFWIAVFALGLLQFYSMIKFSVKSNQVSGLLLQASAVVWFIFAVTFGLDSPPVTTALPIYLLLSFVTVAAGHKLISVNKVVEATK